MPRLPTHHPIKPAARVVAGAPSHLVVVFDNREDTVNKTKAVILAIGLGLATSAGAFMAKQPSAAIPKQYAATEFETIANEIRIQMEPGGRYGYVPSNDRPKIEEQLSVMANLLKGVEVIEELSSEDRVRLFNAQEKINGLLLQHDGQRLVCEKTRVTGSHRPRTVCMTYAEREAAREDSQRLFRVHNRGINPDPNG